MEVHKTAYLYTALNLYSVATSVVDHRDGEGTVINSGG